jgi:poly(beta-D-mannuronate) lyase
MHKFISLFMILCFGVTGILSATTINVNSLSSLQKAINKANPGDLIILDDGIYTTSEKIVIDKQGTATKPIIIAARTIGGVEINGTEGFEINSPAAYVIIKGFKFTHASGKTKIEVGTSHCRITRNVFECKGLGAYLTNSGDDNQIDHNTFQNKSTEGQMISVQGPGGNKMAQRTWIHHNYFYKFANTSNNCGSIQVGLSGRSMASAYTLVEYNLFVQTRGENENICNKSCRNTYRYNTFGEGVSELSLRHGNFCQVYGNFFIGSDGIRFFGHSHKIYSNYFEGCSPAINIGNGDGIIPPAKLTMHDRPDSVQITFNTLVNNKANVIMQGRTNGLGAYNITFANNIIQGGNTAVDIKGNIKNPVWEGNIIWKTGGVGNIPESGYVAVDPKLTQGNNNKYHLQNGSPAINKAVGVYPYVTVDIDGQMRKSKPDIGADQFMTGNVINHILTPAEVGPNSPE